MHCYGIPSGQGNSVNTRRLFFLDAGRIPVASQDSIQFHMVSYCSVIKRSLFILRGYNIDIKISMDLPFENFLHATSVLNYFLATNRKAIFNKSMLHVTKVKIQARNCE